MLEPHLQNRDQIREGWPNGACSKDCQKGGGWPCLDGAWAGLDHVTMIKDTYADAQRLAKERDDAKSNLSTSSGSDLNRNAAKRLRPQTLRAMTSTSTETSYGISDTDVAAAASAKSAGKRKLSARTSTTGTHLHETQATSRAALYSRFVELHLPLLREIGLCWGACAKVLCCSKNLFYHTTGDQEKNMVERLNLGP